MPGRLRDGLYAQIECFYVADRNGQLKWPSRTRAGGWHECGTSVKAGGMSNTDHDLISNC